MVSTDIAMLLQFASLIMRLLLYTNTMNSEMELGNSVSDAKSEKLKSLLMDIGLK